MPHLHQKIQQQRLQLGLTQQEVAELSGVSIRLIRELEAGRANPGLHQLEKLAAALNLTLTLTPNPNAVLDR